MKRLFNRAVVTALILMVNSLFLILNAQDGHKVRGRIVSNGSALQDITVGIKGKAVGTISDSSGEFELQAENGDVIGFYCIGYKTVEVVVGDQTFINVEMEQESIELEEVIAIGYGGVRKKDLTSAISVVKGDELSKRNVSNVSQALQGQLAGVQVASNGGTPGSEASITVRGISSINGNTPLYVVDDIPLDDISWLNPKDIATVQVLKDASASAIFGSRASNGVIIIETTKAKEGVTSVIVDATYSMQSVAKSPDLADATEYAQIANKAAANSGQDIPYTDPTIFGIGTDWWSEITQTAPVQSYSVSVSKGTEDMKISSAASYFKQEGVVKGGDYDRLTFRLSTEFELFDWLTVGEVVNISKDNTTNGPSVIFDAQRIEPLISVYLPEYEQEGRNEYSIYQQSLTTDVANPMAKLARTFNETDYLRVIGNVYAKAEIGYGFSAETRFNVYLSTWENNNFNPDYYISASDKLDVNEVSRTHNNKTNYTWNNLIHYNLTEESHRLKVTGGFMMESYEERTLKGSATDLPNNTENLRYLDTATSGMLTSGNTSSNTLASFLTRVNYSYNDKYLLTASFRGDGSSRFSAENRWGYFPAVSGAWNAKEEIFMEDLDWISQLKVRVGWGQVGNQDISNDALQTTLGQTYYATGVDETLTIGIAPNSVGNEDLKWETVEDMNFGLDFGFFDQDLTVSVDYFSKKSKDMLMSTSIPLYLGAWYNSPITNVGTLETKGVELSLNYRKNLTKDLMFNGTLNISNAKSKITKLANGSFISDGNHQRLDNLTRTEVGETAGSFYGLKTAGIFQSDAEVASYTDADGTVIQPHAVAGDMKFQDLNNDGSITADDRTFIGNPEADITFGLNLGFTYKSWDLNMLFNGTYGNDLLNGITPYTKKGDGIYNSTAGLLEEAWDGAGSTNSQPRLAATDNGNNNFQYSDYYIEDGSYIRLKSAQIGYNLPNDIATKANISRARVFIGGENIFTVTNFSGLDPDLGGSATERGIDWGNYPLPRTFMIGLNISL